MAHTQSHRDTKIYIKSSVVFSHRLFSHLSRRLYLVSLKSEADKRNTISKASYILSYSFKRLVPLFTRVKIKVSCVTTGSSWLIFNFNLT